MDPRKAIRFSVRVRRGRAAIPLVFSIALSGVAVAVFHPRHARAPGHAAKEILVHRDAAGLRRLSDDLRDASWHDRNAAPRQP